MVESVFLTPELHTQALEEELGDRALGQKGRLLLAKGREPAVWAQDMWLEPKMEKVSSISQAAKVLKNIQRNWHLVPTESIRRSRLIEEQLPPLKRHVFPPFEPLPKAPLGAWTLWDENTLLYSAITSSGLPFGELHLIENKDEPPSRAYLKLWEFFTRTQRWPQKGEKCLDLGSAPGGWTWVLAKLGAQVLSVDKAPLDPMIKTLSGVHYHSESAFAMEPDQVGPVDWLFSDVICYPDRLLGMIQKWHASGKVKNFVCTIKFQGPKDHSIVKEFQKIPGAKLMHLFNNKHELTFCSLR